MTMAEQAAFEEIYRNLLPRDGKAERKSRAICVEMIGSVRAEVIRREWLAKRAANCR